MVNDMELRLELAKRIHVACRIGDGLIEDLVDPLGAVLLLEGIAINSRLLLGLSRAADPPPPL